MKILDGKKVNEKIRRSLLRESKILKSQPTLKIIQVGDNGASNIYIAQKIKFAETIGARAEVLRFGADARQTEIVSVIKKINADEKVHGIIVQLPLPGRLDRNKIIDSIDPAKDVDGLTGLNISKLFRGDKDGMIPATTQGIIELLKFYKVPIVGKKVAIVGRSNLVGRPTAAQFLNLDATVMICHSRTKNLKEILRTADIVISAVGKPEFLDKSFFNKKQTVINVGISRDKDGKIVGDIKTVGLEVAALAPALGGVGPMTVACLFQNLFRACKRRG
ncbi:MAG TPA: bifunctional 5,10-methylenetetrahydrofolate dehydrogenase/5,10-methenyltetrahydrofolate cyclohydrolase [Candidatus Paceibacterota bacterium]|nr:bifunctional 5,10-methylenetetrahydrofolate dehydrogenase/5,10-methenyltetrahydrofolate cyclohydrolase [Candidatus Paceibacterota bacterium]HRZ34192.1 bifunctional 5,10-methylenetetrahydrofolate dehydrogenase/5,10-methenyltetrahydrofolate cyclohydrolase [Candidatus Paceibacterota bacterium]